MLTKSALKFLPKFSSLDFVGPKRVPPNIPQNFLAKNLKKSTDKLQEFCRSVGRTIPVKAPENWPNIRECSCIFTHLGDRHNLLLSQKVGWLWCARHHESQQIAGLAGHAVETSYDENNSDHPHTPYLQNICPPNMP